ncbi:MAG: hypothetical protein N2689_09215, partial [Verrucomicrobiae bacterium]|nr:hypothetical protein [Verrucomicrobiae bacterium]
VLLFVSLLMWAPWKSTPVTGRSSVVTPADDAFVREVAALPAEEQVKRVVAELKRLNPKFDTASVSYKIEAGQVVELKFSGTNVADLSPVRALRNLKVLECGGISGSAPYSDLSPLRGLELT